VRALEQPGETRLRLGTAGWAIPAETADAFPADGSGLQRYAGRFDALELNSTFHRRHRASTFARWVEDTPAGFRFAFKAPKTLTHEVRLDVGHPAFEPALQAALEDAGLLGDKLGPVLIQLPPSLAFDDKAERFFARLRDAFAGQVACEPRHASWFETDAETMLASFRVARVAADPARHALAGGPGGWRGLAYWRLHGSPRVYYSSYNDAQLSALAASLTAQLAAEGGDVWCIFDNTASGAAAADALRLQRLLMGTCDPS
jgi:uncharacterized protein YecE (DUF72 family)